MVANRWYGWAKYDWGGDTLRQTYPVLLKGSRIVEIPTSPYAMAVSVNDKGDVLLFNRSPSKTLVYRKGLVTQLIAKLPPDEEFEPLSIAEDGSVLGEAFSANGVLKSKGYFRLVGGKTLPVTSPAKYGFVPSKSSKEPLLVAGLPVMQASTWNTGPNGIEVGYGVHEYEVDAPGGLHPVGDEYALYREKGKILPLANLVSAPPKGMKLEEGGFMNAAGTIAASGRIGDEPALFLLTPVRP